MRNMKLRQEITWSSLERTPIPHQIECDYKISLVHELAFLWASWITSSRMCSAVDLKVFGFKALSCLHKD